MVPWGVIQTAVTYATGYPTNHWAVSPSPPQRCLRDLVGKYSSFRAASIVFKARCPKCASEDAYLAPEPALDYGFGLHRSVPIVRLVQVIAQAARERFSFVTCASKP
jgi:hypothetical protein